MEPLLRELYCDCERNNQTPIRRHQIFKTDQESLPKVDGYGFFASEPLQHIAGPVNFDTSVSPTMLDRRYVLRKAFAVREVALGTVVGME